MIKILELRRAYSIEDAHGFALGAITFDQMCTENVLALWHFAAVEAAEPFGLVDSHPVVTHRVLRALGIVTLTVCGFHETLD